MPDTPEDFFEGARRLSRDLRSASITLSEREARFLVDAYYAMQRDRIRAGHQTRTLTESAEPHDVLLWLENQRDTLERQVARALDAYSGSLQIGQWARSQVGIGPIISAGLACHIDIRQAPTVGHIWRFAGLDPTNKWLGRKSAETIVDDIWKQAKGEEAALLVAKAINVRLELFLKRLQDRKTGEVKITKQTLTAAAARLPWNASLKRLCFIIGESFVKVSGNPDAHYGRAYSVRKQRETEKNANGDYADQAAQALREKRWGDDTLAKKHYENGMLPPARIHMRAKRWATKLFLAHYHHVLYEITFGTQPPLPYIMAKDPLLHTTFIGPPNWPMD